MIRSLVIIFFSTFFGENTFAQVRIACSSNIAYALEEWVRLSELDERVEVIPGATMNLYHQIHNGAPFHIFICADPRINSLIKEYPSWQNSERINSGYLVLWSRQQVAVEKLSSMDLNSNRIGMPDPDTAPFGRLALSKYEELGMDAKKILGDGVIQVNQFIQTNSLDMAFSANTLGFIASDIGGQIIEFKDMKLSNQAHLLTKMPESERVYLRLIARENEDFWKQFGYLIE